MSLVASRTARRRKGLERCAGERVEAVCAVQNRASGRGRTWRRCGARDGHWRAEEDWGRERESVSVSLGTEKREGGERWWKDREEKGEKVEGLCVKGRRRGVHCKMATGRSGWLARVSGGGLGWAVSWAWPGWGFSPLFFIKHFLFVLKLF
jgi:hypothetical protein